MVVGALGNAALAAWVPILTGEAINIIRAGTDKTFSGLLRIAFLIGISQIVRSVLQLARNFSAEMVGQRMERGALRNCRPGARNSFL